MKKRRTWRDISLSWRLTALYVAILAVVLTALGVVLYVRVEHFLLDDTAGRLQAAAHSSVVRAASFRRGPGGQENPGGPSPDINRLNGLTGELSSRDTVARVISADGAILASGQTFPDQPDPPVCDPNELRRVLAGETLPPTTIRNGSQHLFVMLLPLQVGDGTPEVLQLTTSLAAADSLLAQLRLILALGALGAVVAGAALGVPVTRAALRPLARVTATSERIAAGDLGQRTDLPAGRDEIGRLAAAFDRMVDQLEATLRAQRQFVADASHELRTPLTSLGGLIEMVLLGADRGDAATTQRALRSAHREIERLARLVSDLLTLSRLDAHPPIARRPFDLAALAADVGEQNRFLAGERTVACQVDGPLPVEGDADRLKQVLLNLTGNAVAFTAPAGRIEIRAGRHDGRARVVVADNGLGIDPADLPHLFERFYRGDKSRARRRDDGGGSGLGLAIAQAILEAHAGTIAVQSTPGQGTTFTVELPLASAAAASGVSARAPAPPATVS
ncbi:MAG: sensor histidine kinase [Thermomicrobiales bacterium]